MTVNKTVLLTCCLLLVASVASAETLVNLGIQSAEVLLRGGAPEDRAGSALASADFNDDGIADLLVGARESDGSGGRVDSGRAYVLLGNGSFPAEYKLTMSTVNMNLTVTGSAAGDHLGTSVAAGDLNGDNIADMIIAAPEASPSGRFQAGAIYVLYGTSAITSQQHVDLSSATPSLRIYGPSAGSRIGLALATGDVNDDGTDDLLIGAPVADATAGRVYVIYGSALSPGSLIDLASTPADVDIQGRDADDALGSSLATGDLNNDTIDDFILGAPHAEGPNHIQSQSWGEAYVFYGSSSLPSAIDLGIDTPDVEVRGARADDQLGEAVAAADFNGDGTDDLIVGAPQFDVTLRQDVGAVFVYHGGGFPANALRFGTTPNANFSVLGDTPLDLFGMALAGGDSDGDGIDDLFIGAPQGDYFFQVDRGKAYIIKGRTDYAANQVYDLDNAEAFLFAIGADTTDLLGTAILAGDLDDDGLAEMVVGAPNADPENLLDKGAVYILSDAAYPEFDAEIISHNITPWWYVGQKRYISVSVKNMGLRPWRSSDIIQLAALDDSDPLAGAIRYDLPASPLFHGEVATFVIEMTAPGDGGVYTTDWQMAQNGTLFGEVVSEQVNVTERGMDSLFVNETIPWNVAAGSTVHPVNITFRNIGSCQWSADALFNLRTLLNPFSAASLIDMDPTAAVKTGETYTWPLNFTTSGASGSLGTAWKVHRSTVKWIGDPMGTRMNWGSFPRWSTFVDSTMPQKVRAGSPFGFQIQFSNDGSVDWTAADDFGVWVVGPNVLKWANNGQVFWPLDPGTTVSPGEIHAFDVLPAANEVPGVFDMTLRVVEDGAGDFGGIHTQPIEVITGPKRVAEWTGFDAPEVVVANSTFPVTLEMTNHGIKSWLGSRGYRLEAVGGTAPFVAPSAIPLAATETLLTGSSKTFRFDVTAPATPGTYSLTYRMAQTSSGPFGEVVKFDVKVTNANWDATIISDTIPDKIAANDKAIVEVVVRNDGLLSWTESTKVRLGIEGDPTKFTAAQRATLRSTEIVTTGETTCFQFAITAPSTVAVTDTFRIQMIQDNGAPYFGEALFKTIEVIANQYGSELVNLSAPSSVTVNEDFEIAITMRNTGARVWNDEDLFYMEERTTDVTPFIGSFRDYMDPYTRVDNGETYTFVFPLKAPAGPGGPYTLEFKVVDHGVARFGVTVPVNITVTAAPPSETEDAWQDPTPADSAPVSPGVTEYYVVDNLGGLHALNGGALAQLPSAGLPVVDAVATTDSVLGLDEQGVLYDITSGDVGNDLIGLPLAKDVEILNGEAAVLDGYGVVHGSSLTAGHYFGWDIARDLAATPDGAAYILDGHGVIHALLDAPSLDAPFLGVDQAVALQLRSDGSGGYMLDAAGNVYALGNAPDLGSADLEETVAVDLVLTESEAGYYVLDADGGVTAFGDAAAVDAPALGDDAQAVGLLKVQR